MEAIGVLAFLAIIVALGVAIFVKKLRKRALIAAGAAFVIIVIVAAVSPQPSDNASASKGVAQVAQKESAPPKDPAYQDMSLADFKLDKEKLVGKKVRVIGLYQSVGDTEILASEPMDSNPIWIDAKSLPRDQRKILQSCEDRSCSFEVEGRVSKGVLGIEIVVSKIVKQ